MSVRCFIAIELPDEVRELLTGVEDVVQASDERWRGEKWVPEANLHVTLKFVGHIAEENVSALVSACTHEVAPLHPFEIAAASIRAVPGPGRARMLWGAFLDPSGQGAELAAACDRAALTLGVEPETRWFKPHVTLVRARSPHAVAAEALERANEALTCGPGIVSVTAATVFQSKLSRLGPTYVPLAHCPLGG